ncbi:MAG: Uma2 family endonuclease [bacterium]
MSVQLAKKLFTVDEYHNMIDACILTEDDRVELLGGEIVEMSPIGSRHAAIVNRLNHIFNQRLGNKTIVSIQNPIHLGIYSEPEPDLALLKPRPDFYATAHPEPDDVLLVIEVAETSAYSDREVKIPLYANAGIREVWLEALIEQYIEVYKNPIAERSEYGSVVLFEPEQYLSSQAFANIKFDVGEILQ